jgi:hypothetical protein
MAVLRNFHLGLKVRASAWRVGLCLVLAVLFLYNPFLTIFSTSQSVNIQHPLSYRATIASSELRRCTAESAKPLVPVLEAAVAFELKQTAPNKEVLFTLPHDLFRAMPCVICNDLWFRPPPSL